MLILPDVEETVVAKVLTALTSLCELGLFQKMRIWELMSATLGFLYHPNMWIRQGEDWTFLHRRHINFYRCFCVYHLGRKASTFERRVVYPLPVPAALFEVGRCNY
jgi:hypothetical protein